MQLQWPQSSVTSAENWTRTGKREPSVQTDLNCRPIQLEHTYWGHTCLRAHIAVEPDGFHVDDTCHNVSPLTFDNIMKAINRRLGMQVVTYWHATRMGQWPMMTREKRVGWIRLYRWKSSQSPTAKRRSDRRVTRLRLLKTDRQKRLQNKHQTTRKSNTRIASLQPKHK
jgi:hypothetical protein